MIAAIPDEFRSFVDAEIASGRFRSEQEAIAEGLRLLQHRESKLQLLRAELIEGVEELERGEGIEADQVFRELRGRVDELDKQIA
jgi:putative addiction module CopG family antidote